MRAAGALAMSVGQRPVRVSGIPYSEFPNLFSVSTFDSSPIGGLHTRMSYLLHDTCISTHATLSLCRCRNPIEMRFRAWHRGPMQLAPCYLNWSCTCSIPLLVFRAGIFAIRMPPAHDDAISCAWSSTLKHTFESQTLLNICSAMCHYLH